MQEVEENVQDKWNDALPDIFDQFKDVSDDEEEQDEYLSMFDIPPVDDQNEQEEDDEENDENDEDNSGEIPKAIQNFDPGKELKAHSAGNIVALSLYIRIRSIEME